MLHDSADAAESLQDAFILAAAKLSELPELSKLRPWLFALTRNECRRRIRPGSATRDEVDVANPRADGGQRADEAERPAAAVDGLTDATMPIPVVSQSASAIGPLTDATMQFRAVSESADATVQFPAAGPFADATMQFRVVSESADATDGLADVNGYVGQAELRTLIRSILADMRSREREVVELSFRHDLDDNDLAIVLGMSFSRAHALASRARGRLEKSFGALRTALAGRQACPVMGELLADWDGQLSEQTRDLVVWHIEQCQTCINRAQGGLRPTVLSGLLPLAPLPPELRAKVLNHCSSTAEDALVYRRLVLRRAEAKWAALFSQAIRRVSWDSVRANPGPAIAATAVAMWVVTAVILALLTFGGFHAAQVHAAQPTGSSAPHAQAAQTSAATPPSSPATVQLTATAPAAAAARPSPAHTQPVMSVSTQVQPSPSRSSSPKPSKSASPQPSKSASPQPSKSASPSPSPSPSRSSSPTPSPTT
jgi:RNA polymerase sigma factor (sigma-70 family)